MEEIKEIERLSKVIDDVMNESDLFNKTLLEVAYRLKKRIILYAWMGGITVEDLIKEYSEILKFIEEKYNELPYSNNGDYFQAMLSKLQQDKHESHVERIKEEKKKRLNK